MAQKCDTYRGLKAGLQIDKKRMLSGVYYFKNSLFRQKTFHFVSRYDIALFKSLDGTIMARFLVLNQDDLSNIKFMNNGHESFFKMSLNQMQ